MNTCKSKFPITLQSFRAVDVAASMRYKVMGRKENGEEVVVHRCNSATEAQDVWQETFSHHINTIGAKSRTYSAVWWTLNNPAPLRIFIHKG